MPFTAASRQIARGAKPLAIVATYVALASAWILASDYLLQRLDNLPLRPEVLATLKGLLFVAVTGAVLWGLLAARQRRIDRALEIIRERVRDLISLMDNTRDFVVRFDRDLRHVFVNRALCEAAGISREEYLGKTNEELGMAPEDCALWNSHLRQVFETGEEHTFEFEFTNSEGVRRDYMARVFPERDETGEVKTILSIVRDVTPLREKEREVAAAKRLLEETFEALSDAVFLIDPVSRRILNCNRAAEELFACPRAELIGESTRILHVDDEHFEKFQRMGAEALEKTGRFRTKFKMRRRDGSLVETEHTVSVLWDASGRWERAVSLVRDIGKEMQYEQSLRRSRDILRKLARRLTEREEYERRRFAQDLHDRVGQSVTAVGINVNLIERALAQGDVPTAKARVAETNGHLQTINERVRDLISELRPAVLDDYGIEPALKELAAQFERQAEIPVTVSAANLDHRLSDEVETTFYRIAQEALANVAKHAKATRVEIALKIEPGMIRLSLRDDGAGFDLRARRPENRSWGLEIMGERAAAVGGEMRVDSAPGKGTVITVEVPRPS